MRSPLSQQIEELDLVCRAKANALGRARAGEIKRPLEWVERRANVLAALQAALETLETLMGLEARGK